MANRKRSNYKITVYCSFCGKKKEVNPCRFKEGKRFFCGPEHKQLSERGKKLSEETKQKISDAKGGRSTEKRICVGCGIEFECDAWSDKIYHDLKCSGHHIGKQSHEPWNKHETKETNAILKKKGKEHSKTMKKKFESGYETWNKGLTKETDERVAKYVETQTKQRNTEGEWKEQWKDSLRKGQVRAYAAGKYPSKFTKPEKITWAYLESLGFLVKPADEQSDDDQPNTWYHQYNFFDAFNPDFACPDLQAIIEVNGCAVHGHSKEKCSHRTAKYAWPKMAAGNIKRDRRKYSMYHRRGWKWALVWECEADKGDFHRLHERLGL